MYLNHCRQPGWSELDGCPVLWTGPSPCLDQLDHAAPKLRRVSSSPHAVLLSTAALQSRNPPPANPGHTRASRKPGAVQSVVECLVWASVLATVSSQVLHRLARSAVARDRHVPLLRWASLFARVAADLLRLVLGRGNDTDDALLFRHLVHEAPDPNRNRQDRALAPFIPPHARTQCAASR